MKKIETFTFISHLEDRNVRYSREQIHDVSLFHKAARLTEENQDLRVQLRIANLVCVVMLVSLLAIIGTFLFKPQIAHVEPSAVVRRLISGEANSR